MTVFMFVCRVVILVCICIGYSRCRHPFVTAARNSISGVGAMLLVNLLSGYTGCYIAVNTATVFVSSVLSMPGVVCLLVMKLIYNY
ncbi:MAG: pro-sigmaK processing inhibitor BofA family protein [Oscillospiraceae bacterium]|nr:pro-sigmaK processing inhibitor BofA family protein [Oscillospiraceae bacterium]